MPRLLRSARWEADAVRDDVRCQHVLPGAAQLGQDLTRRALSGTSISARVLPFSCSAVSPGRAGRVRSRTTRTAIPVHQAVHRPQPNATGSATALPIRHTAPGAPSSCPASLASSRTQDGSA
jgi:hypothetical protein